MAVVPLDNIQSIALKLPQFWADGAKIWFAQAESQFAIKNINNELTKYHHGITALPNEIAVKLIDFFENVPEEEQVFTEEYSSKDDFSCNAATPGANNLLSYSWSS